jgi:predicted GIY-YIG superfamily endonuclease
MSTNIYILRLTQGKYYVGKTNNLERRHQEHINGTASAWTRKYTPVAVEKIIPNSSHFDEDKWTKEYMNKYGIQNVRGGSYTEIHLNDFQMDTLKTEIWGAKNLCKQCGRSGHFAKTCYAKSDVHGIPIEYEDDSDDSDDSDSSEDNTYTYYTSSNKVSGACYRCGRSSHYSPDCYATHHIDGSRLY